jgi:hypothetical protein
MIPEELPDLGVKVVDFIEARYAYFPAGRAEKPPAQLTGYQVHCVILPPYPDNYIIFPQADKDGTKEQEGDTGGYDWCIQYSMLFESPSLRFSDKILPV